MMSDLSRWAALISRLKGEEQSNMELLRNKRKSPADGQIENDKDKGRGG